MRRHPESRPAYKSRGSCFACSCSHRSASPARPVWERPIGVKPTSSPYQAFQPAFDSWYQMGSETGLAQHSTYNTAKVYVRT